jgi:hypothetical protein
MVEEEKKMAEVGNGKRRKIEYVMEKWNILEDPLIYDLTIRKNEFTLERRFSAYLTLRLFVSRSDIFISFIQVLDFVV